MVQSSSMMVVVTQGQRVEDVSTEKAYHIGLGAETCYINVQEQAHPRV